MASSILRKLGVIFSRLRAFKATSSTILPVERSVILCQASSTAGTPLLVSWPPTQSVGSIKPVFAPDSAEATAQAKAAVEPPTITTSNSRRISRFASGLAQAAPPLQLKIPTNTKPTQSPRYFKSHLFFDLFASLLSRVVVQGYQETHKQRGRRRLFESVSHSQRLHLGKWGKIDALNALMCF